MAIKKGDFVFAKVKGYPSWPAIVDQVEEKNRIKYYNVTFFGTKEISKCKQTEVCLYSENKSKLGIPKEKNASFNLALQEIEKAIKLKLNRSTTPRTPVSLSRMTSKRRRTISPQNIECSTPNTNTSETQTDVDLTIDGSTSTANNDKAINTSIDMDLSYQLEAVTNRCIELECEKNLNDKVDFQTQIILQELKASKLEIENLNAIISVLRKDYEGLEDKLKQDRNPQQKCLSCFPTLDRPGTSGSQWQTPSHTSRNKVVTQVSHVPHHNQYEVLSETEAEEAHNDEPTPIQNIQPQENTQEKQQNKNLNPIKKQLAENKTYGPSSRLLIMADSHGRDIYNLLQSKTPANVTAYVRPSAKFNGVTEDIADLVWDLSKNDNLLVLAGTNDVQHTKVKHILNDVKTLLLITQHTNLIIATLPMRHDRPDLDKKLTIINEEIEKLIRQSSSNTKILTLHDLPRHYYTNHGLHFNRKGKEAIIERILECTSAPATSQNMTEDVMKKTKHIHVVEGNMEKFIQERRQEETTAFAHCISADFGESKHMSQGVATVFAEHVGKPTASDCATPHLTCQKKDGAVVYGLVTKPKYYHKPRIDNYDAAFEDMTTDFEKRGLKNLICSPMGCTRDGVLTQHFVMKLVQFQQRTGAEVQVITCNEETHERLRRGISYTRFLKRLRNTITLMTANKEMPRAADTPTPLISLNDTSQNETQTDSDISFSSVVSNSNISNLSSNSKNLLAQKTLIGT